MSAKWKKPVLIVCCLLIGISNPTLSFAQPNHLDQKEEEANQVRRQLRDIDYDLEVTVEQYNLANYRLRKTKENIQQSKKKQRVTVVKLSKQHKLLGSRIVSIYKGGNTGFTSTLVGAKSFTHFLTCVSYLIQIGNQDIELLERIKKTKRELELTEQLLRKEEFGQSALLSKLGRRKRSIKNQIADRTSYLNSVNDDIQNIIKEEDEQEARAQAEAVQRLRRQEDTEEPAQDQPANQPNEESPAHEPRNEPTNKPNDDKDNVKKPADPPKSPVPTKPSNTQVMSIAMQHLGKPYQWGAAGPDSFDCSGLVMYCYAQIGISLPHSAAAQYNRGIKIDRDNLSAGDLVFFGKTGVSHVGIYTGGGNYIHAPRTGDVVKVSAISSRKDYFGACRP